MLELSEGIKILQDRFNSLPSKYLLMNGNVEKPLKFMVGSCCEGIDENFSYIMDKRIKRKEIDMIGFLNGKPIISAEFKCTFSYDRSLTIRAAKDASKKILKTFELEILEGSNKKIVHFLNHSIGINGSSLNPDWIKSKYPKFFRFHLGELIRVYVNELGNNFQDFEIIPFNFKCSDLGLEALVIHLDVN